MGMRYLQQRLPEIAPTIAEYLSQNPNLAVFRATLALAHLRAGNRESAIAEFHHLADDTFAVTPRDQLWLGSMCLLAEACALMRDRSRSRWLYDVLLPYRRRNAQIGMSFCLGSVERFLGLLADTLDDDYASAAHLEAAINDNHARGLRAAAAIVSAEYAELLLRHGVDERALAALHDTVTE